MDYLQGKLPNSEIFKPLSVRVVEAGAEDKVFLETLAADDLFGIQLLGSFKTEVVTVAGAEGTLSLTIAGTAYAESFDTDIETTIDNWLASHAAALLAAHEVTATKSDTDEITLVCSVWKETFTYADTSTTLTATGDGGTTTWPTFTGPFSAVRGISNCTLDATGTVVYGSNANAATKLWDNLAVANAEKLTLPFTSIRLATGRAIAFFAA